MPSVARKMESPFGPINCKCYSALDSGSDGLINLDIMHGTMGSPVPNNLLSCRPRNDGPYDGPINNSIDTTQNWPIGGQVAAASDQ